MSDQKILRKRSINNAKTFIGMHRKFKFLQGFNKYLIIIIFYNNYYLMYLNNKNKLLKF